MRGSKSLGGCLRTYLDVEVEEKQEGFIKKMSMGKFSVINGLKRFRYFRLVFISWSLLIIISSTIPHLPDPKIKVPVPGAEMKIRIDYVIHFLEFFVLSILFIFMKMNHSAKLKFKHISWYVVLGMAGAFLIEVYQELIPGRTFNLIDFIYNSLGLVTGILFTYLLKINKRKDLIG